MNNVNRAADMLIHFLLPLTLILKQADGNVPIPSNWVDWLSKAGVLGLLGFFFWAISMKDPPIWVPYWLHKQQLDTNARLNDQLEAQIQLTAQAVSKWQELTGSEPTQSTPAPSSTPTRARGTTKSPRRPGE